MYIFNCSCLVMRAAALSVYRLALPSLNKVDTYIHTYIHTQFFPLFSQFHDKLGVREVNTLNREGWNFWKNKTLWKRISEIHFSMHLQAGLHPRGGGGRGYYWMYFFVYR